MHLQLLQKPVFEARGLAAAPSSQACNMLLTCTLLHTIFRARYMVNLTYLSPWQDKIP